RRGRGRRAGGHRMSRLRWWAKALTPPIVLLGLRKLFPKKEPVPEPAAAEPAEWEHVPEGWGRPVPGWDAKGVLTSYERKWPAFHDAHSCLARRYDLVLSSSSLHCSEDWRGTLAGLARATAGYLYLTRVPLARRAPSFVVLQRAQRHGYGTEYLGWVLNRDELLGAAREAGLELVRE